MTVAEIPVQMDIRCPPFTSVYRKRNMRDPNLFCWFNTEEDDYLPHVSVHVNTANPIWDNFHVTFPVLHQGGWDAEAERRSFSIYYETQNGKWKFVRDNRGDIRLTDANPLGFNSMVQLAHVFALRFIQKAMIQSALA